MKIDYQSKKWEKEIKNLEKFKKSIKGDLLIQEKYKVKKFEESEKKDFVYFYFNLNSGYFCTERYLYKDNVNNIDCMKYTYLSAIALFYVKKMRECGQETEYPEIVDCELFDMDYVMYQLISVNETEFELFKDEKNIVSLLFNQEYEKAKELIEELPNEVDESIEVYYVRAVHLKKIYESIIEKNEKKFNEELIKRIKKYRKNMVGYSTIIDITSIALIKLAKKAGINYTFDVIEIPKMYLAETYKIDKEKVKMPYYDEFVKAGVLKEEWGR